MKKKALVLFSWGLDSLLTIKILQNQWIKVTALSFETPFFKSKKASELSEYYKFPLIVKDISDPHFDIVKKPKFWYWKNMNPCIDCHWFMFKVAKSVADEKWFNIIASWEVYWQRPFSQNKEALKKVLNIAWCDILRPLSAKLLQETVYEKLWLVNRKDLFSIEWKSREAQLKLVKEFWLDRFTPSWWWCILTMREYSSKLREYLSTFNDIAESVDAELIKHWRIKFFKSGSKNFYWVMWRNESDNAHLLNLFKKLNKKYIMYNLIDFPWPRVILFTFWQRVTKKLEKDVLQWITSKVSKEIEWKINFKKTCFWSEKLNNIIL